MPPAAKKTSKKKKDGADSGEPKKKKARNFSQVEDLLLCKAYVNASENPRVGVGQKLAEFWGSVKEAFDALYVSEGVEEPLGKEERDHESLMNRFSRQIQPTVNRFNKYFRQIKLEQPSGTPFSEYIRLAKERYEENEPGKFKFEECVPILHAMPKFDPMAQVEEIELDDDEEEDDPSASNKDAVNKIGAPMGHHMPRPVGCKAAKKMAADDMTLSSQMRGVKDGQMELVSAIKESNQLRRAKEKKAELFKLFEAHRAMGDMEGANSYLRQVKELRDKEQEEERLEAQRQREEAASSSQISPSVSNTTDTDVVSSTGIPSVVGVVDSPIGDTANGDVAVV